jgi:hypothetical protein
MDAFIISSLPPILSKDCLTIGPLCSPDITPVQCYCGPIRHPLAIYLTSQQILVIELIFSSNFSLGQVGLLQSLGMSLLPCCRYHPAGIVQTKCQFSLSMLPSPPNCRLGFQSFISITRPPVRSLTLRPGNLLITPKMTLSMGFRRFGYPPLCHSSYRASGFYPDRTVSC